MNRSRALFLSLAAVVLAPLALTLGGCGKSAPADALGGPPKVPFQLDWYPQPEHGGFFQAFAQGYYKDVGLDVNILPGGPAARSQAVDSGFAMGRADDIMFSVNQGIPVIIVGAFMEHDPHAIMFHKENPIKSFKDLDGKAVMLTPGAAWYQYLEAHYGIHINVIPLNFGLAQFMSDKKFMQQCFVTSEPFFVAKAGANPGTLMVSSSGYENYRVIYTSKKFAREHPDIVRAFVAASVKGWNDFVTGDPKPGKALIHAGNDQMSEELMDFSIKAMKDLALVTGYPDKGERTGMMTRKRMQTQLDTLKSLKIVGPDLPLEKVVDFSFLPDDLKPLVDAP